MSYQVIARRWRPQKFEDVVYQDHISVTIKNSIVKGRIHHAYLFSGPRGVGKTTMARILAKALNCLSTDGPTDSPCDTCENCIEIREGFSFDVIEIDGASNRGIDNIRELRENVNLAPVKARYKVYIIDEVHMLTKEAFNALLKTLEEPPAHVVFIFATTELHRIPETILSRCQKFQFKKIPVDATVSHLKRIVETEGYKIDQTALYPLARAAEGSMRDSQSLLEQAISFSDGNISEQDAFSILGVVALDSYLNLLNAIKDTSAVDAINEIEKVIMMGVDIPRYVAGLADILRAVRLVRNGISVQKLLGFSNDEIAQIKKIADSFYDEELGAIFRLTGAMQNNLRYTGNERIVVEMAVLDMISVKKTPSIASIIKKIESMPQGAQASSEHGQQENILEKKEQKPDTVKAAPKEAKAENKIDSAVDSIKNLFHGEVIE